MMMSVLGVKRERKRPHTEAKCFPKSSSFPLETAKVSAREKKRDDDQEEEDKEEEEDQEETPTTLRGGI